MKIIEFLILRILKISKIFPDLKILNYYNETLFVIVDKLKNIWQNCPSVNFKLYRTFLRVFLKTIVIWHMVKFPWFLF